MTDRRILQLLVLLLKMYSKKKSRAGLLSSLSSRATICVTYIGDDLPSITRQLRCSSIYARHPIILYVVVPRNCINSASRPTVLLLLLLVVQRLATHYSDKYTRYSLSDSLKPVFFILTTKIAFKCFLFLTFVIRFGLRRHCPRQEMSAWTSLCSLCHIAVLILCPMRIIRNTSRKY